MPQPLQNPIRSATRSVQAVVDAQTAAHTAALNAAEASDQARGSRGLLAAAIREAAAAIYGSVSVFCDVVHAEKGTPAKSVWNALYSTFGSDILARCVEVLEDHLVPAGGNGQIRRAA